MATNAHGHRFGTLVFEINWRVHRPNHAGQHVRGGPSEWPLIWRAYAHWVEAKPLQAGEYELPANASPFKCVAPVAAR